VFVINRFLFIKYITCIKKIHHSVLIGQSRPGGKTAFLPESSELTVEGAVPLATIVLSYHVFKCSRICRCKTTLKISAGL